MILNLTLISTRFLVQVHECNHVYIIRLTMELGHVMHVAGIHIHLLLSDTNFAFTTVSAVLPSAPHTSWV